MNKVVIATCFLLFQLFGFSITEILASDNQDTDKIACSAVVAFGDRTATFTFPNVTDTNWTWYRDTTADNNLEYSWSISLNNGDSPIYNFGAYLFKFPGSKQQDGSLKDLLRKCQFSVCDSSGNLNHWPNLSYKIKDGMVILFIDDLKTFNVFFQSRPLYAYFHIRLPGKESISCEAQIDYSGFDDSLSIENPPGEVKQGIDSNAGTRLYVGGNVDIIRKWAEKGNAEKQLTLGVMYETGTKVQQDYIEAESWYRRAAEQGYAPAQTALGSLFKNGRGVPKDYAEALKWYTEAAKKEDMRAQFALGEMYDNGLGVQEDQGEAAKWYRKVAEKGFVLAQFSLGSMYENGSGVPKDYTQAVNWYRKAAEQGEPRAQNNLGWMCADGLGVPQDYAEAVKWFLKAAAHDFAYAQYSMGVACRGGKGVAQDYAEAVKWFREAAEQEHAGAQYYLGAAYAKGEGVAQDYVQAHRWLILAVKHGVKEAAELSNTVAAKMTPAQIDEAQRLAREWKPKGKD